MTRASVICHQKGHVTAKAVAEAVQRAHAHLTEKAGRVSPRRLPLAQAITLGQNWMRLGDELDTWLIRSVTKASISNGVSSRCNCPDLAP